MPFTFSNKCPICNKRKTIKGGHPACSKIMQEKRIEEKEKLRMAARRRDDFKRRSENPERVKANQKKYINNLGNEQKENIKKSQQTYHSNHKIESRLKTAKRRAQKKISGCKLSKDIIKKLFNQQDNKCVYCNIDISNNFHLDHIMPLALGGLHTDENIQLLCPRCNLKKGSKHPIDFMQSHGNSLNAYRGNSK